MTFKVLLKQPAGFFPLAMSGAALLTIGIHIVFYGTAQQTDEGAAAHIWQILMIAQILGIAFFAGRHFGKAPKQALALVSLQIAAFVATLLPSRCSSGDRVPRASAPSEQAIHGSMAKKGSVSI